MDIHTLDKAKLANISKAIKSEANANATDTCEGETCLGCQVGKFIRADPMYSRAVARMGASITDVLAIPPDEMEEEEQQQVMDVVISAMYVGFELAWRYMSAEQLEHLTTPAETGGTL